MGLISLMKNLLSRRGASRPSVSEIMSALPAETEVIIDIQYDTSQIDYTAFTRQQGIFVIRVLRDRGLVSSDGKTLLLNGRPRPDVIKNSLRDTFFIKSMIRDRVGIDAYVTPLVVMERAAIRENISLLGVLVIPPEEVLTTLTHAPERPALPDGVLIYLREIQMMRTQFLRR